MRSFSALALVMFAGRATATEFHIKAGDDFEASCLHMVQPGDTCYLEKGDYNHDGLTVTHGTADARITITGDPAACIKGSNTQDRVLQIAHNFYTIKDICFDGQHDDDYVATAIYALGADRKSEATVAGVDVTSSVTGLQLFDLEIKNFGSECVHLRYFVTGTEMEGCTIQHCGIDAFENGGGGKVGEAVYVGTALDQVDDGKAPEPKLRTGSADNVDADNCSMNYFHHNTFRTYGNECIDVKEGSTNNLIEYNICEQQRDPNSGGFDLRGSKNIVRNNEISSCTGAAVRVGGDKNYGVGNHVYGNVIKDMGAGAFNVMQGGQGTVCGNEVSGASALAVGAYKDDAAFSEAQATGKCSEEPDHTGLGGSSDGGSSPDSTSDDKDSTSKDETDTGSSDSTATSDGKETSPDDKKSSSDDSTSGDSGDSKSDMEGTDEGVEAGVNFTDQALDSEPEISTIETNDAAGTGGQGQCGTVVGVSQVMVDHAQYVDPTTDVNSLFDADPESYFSVNRESTRVTLELNEEVEVNGVAIGFFMKAAEEQRIQTFDIAVRSGSDDEWTTVISRSESSGEMGVMQTFPFSGTAALYVRFESHGNDFNNWTALFELEVCTASAAESNALFGGVKAVGKELQQLAGQVCASPIKLSPKKVVSSGRENVEVLFDGRFDTRWTTENTQDESDLNNDKVMMTFKGDVKVSSVKVAFFDGTLAHQYISIYTQSASAKTWNAVASKEQAKMSDSLQSFPINEKRVTRLYIVGKGNDVALYSKISEIEVWGC